MLITRFRCLYIMQRRGCVWAHVHDFWQFTRTTCWFPPLAGGKISLLLFQLNHRQNELNYRKDEVRQLLRNPIKKSKGFPKPLNSRKCASSCVLHCFLPNILMSNMPQYAMACSGLPFLAKAFIQPPVLCSFPHSSKFALSLASTFIPSIPQKSLDLAKLCFRM